MSQQLIDYCLRAGIQLNGETDSQKIRIIIREHERAQRLKDAKSGPPFAVSKDDGDGAIKIMHFIPLESRTFIDPFGKEQARTFAVSKDTIGLAPAGTEFIVAAGCRLDDPIIPLICNYPSLELYGDEFEPINVLRASIIIYNGQNGVSAEDFPVEGEEGI